MMKIVSIVGARPQFVKAAVVSRALRATACVHEVLVHTGQHYDDNMSKVFFEELEIPQPDYNLGVGSGSHGVQTGRMLQGIEEVLLAEQPDVVVVYGDTNSTLAGALAAVKLQMPVAHVEAGLRSFNRRMPEEINRVLTDHASDLLFAPTEAAVKNLRTEGIPEQSIVLTGDVMYDAALLYAAKAEEKSRILDRLGLELKGYALATVHRAENTDDPARLAGIMEGLGQVAKELPLVMPLHPRTHAALAKGTVDPDAVENLKLIEPVGYLDMLWLEKNARVVITDSGGVQKEAFFYRVPCVTLRGETEWGELVDLGWNRLVPDLRATTIREAVLAALDQTGSNGSPYGDGHASELVCHSLLHQRSFGRAEISSYMADEDELDDTDGFGRTSTNAVHHGSGRSFERASVCCPRISRTAGHW